MKEKTGYACPYCGAETTAVLRTNAFRSCVIRYRKCLACGKTHETTEIPMEISSAWREAVAILLERKQARDCLKLAQNGANLA